MVWARWEHLNAGDPRWPVSVIDTDDLPPADVAARVAAWAREALAES